MNKFMVKMPIHVEIGIKKKRKYYLNINLYRNNHMHTNNNIKKEYKRIAAGVLPQDVFYDRYELEYKLFLPNKLKRDVSNVCGVVDKFFNDALVELGIVPEDNYQYLRKITYVLGGYDENKVGYVEITVKERFYEDL